MVHIAVHNKAVAFFHRGSSSSHRGQRHLALTGSTTDLISLGSTNGIVQITVGIRCVLAHVGVHGVHLAQFCVPQGVAVTGIGHLGQVVIRSIQHLVRGVQHQAAVLYRHTGKVQIAAHLGNILNGLGCALSGSGHGATGALYGSRQYICVHRAGDGGHGRFDHLSREVAQIQGHFLRSDLHSHIAQPVHLHGYTALVQILGIHSAGKVLGYKLAGAAGGNRVANLHKFVLIVPVHQVGHHQVVFQYHQCLIGNDIGG